MTTELQLLIVDDSEDDARLLLRELQKCGYEPKWERVDTPEAMRAALVAQEWDVVVSDFSMPRFSGLDALRMVKVGGLDIPFIIVSGKIGEETAVEAMRSGAHDYIIKGSLARLAPAIDREMADAVVRRKRRQAEDALRESEGRYRILLESVTDYIYTTHVEEGRPVATSHGPGCTAVTGYSAEEYAVDPGLWLRMVPEEDRAAVLKHADTVLAGKELSALEHRIIRKDGRTRWIRNTPVPRHNQEGRLIAFDGIVTDITNFKNLENQLLQSQKMEAIGQLAGGIAHDFNNILTAIIGFSTLIEMDMEKDDPQRSNLSHVLAAADRAADLTRSLLTFSRKQIIDPQTVDLNQIIRKIDTFLKRIIGEDIVFRTTFMQDVIAVKADSVQIEQVLINLANNARDAMPNGGLLSLETGTVEVDDEYIMANGFGEPGRYACISVSDSGEGMDQATCKKVFEPFFTTKEVGKGTGLGLSIVFGIVKQHHGFINVYSEPGSGTTFKILLPLIQTTVEEKHADEEENIEKGMETILVADDDAALRELAEKILTMFGYTVIMAVDGSDAVARFKANRDRIDLVILDIIMPEMNGKEAFDEMRKINPAVKGVFISGYTGDIIRKRGLMEQGIDFIAKPLNLKQLLIKIRDVLSREG
jgi:hypothetical protein